MALKFCLLATMAFIHLTASRIRFLQVIPRSIWLSIAGGASVAYVFLHLIPELIEAREEFTLLEHDLSIFIIALIGLCFIYGMERLAKSKKRGDNAIFYIHIASYGIYNFIIGYLLVSRSAEGIIPLLLFFFAMGLHFIVDDVGLLYHHKVRYLKTGKWIIAGAVLAGGIIAAIAPFSAQIIHIGIAFISGGIIMNVLKEELPEERRSRYWAFLLGAGGYASLLLFLNNAE